MKRRATIQNRTIVAYCRVSTEEQVVDGVSLDAQQAKLRAYCAATGRDNIEMIVDSGESAKSLNRPGMNSILARVNAGEISAIVVLKLDRLTRSVGDLSTLVKLFNKTNTALVSATENLDTSTAAGRMMINALGMFAEFERESICERTSFALGYKRVNRKAYCYTPFGYRREGNDLIEIPEQIEAVATVRSMNDSGVSLRKCGAYLESLGFMSPHGKSWSAQGVKDMLDSKIRG